MRVHLIAIGGSAMHNLALALKHAGHEVSGSDDEIFEPSRGRLELAGLLPQKMGWDANRITSDLDYVVLGMHARKDNPEMLRAQELGLKLLSYPEFLYQTAANKTRVVIAGSHGKTSITAMILHCLHYHEKDCDFMVGAQLEGFERMVKFSEENEFMLLEGDEYLSSPLDARPKFVHYHPNIALLSGIAWDHINVFPTFEDYKQQFNLLLDQIEPGGVIVYNANDPEVKSLVEAHPKELKKFPYTLPDYRVEGGRFVLETFEGDVELKIFGQHNMSNLEGARWICNQMGLTDEEFYEAIGSFEGASQRLEKIDLGDQPAFRDFAHAPSKVRATVSAMKENYPDKQVLAVLELHTFSSLNPAFLPQYQGSLTKADEAIVFYNPEVASHKRLEILGAEEIRKAFGAPNLKVATHRSELLSLVKEKSSDQSAYLFMSSGNFGGIDWAEELR